MTTKTTNGPRLDEMSSITVELQTIEDAKKGLLLFGGYQAAFEENGAMLGELASIGIMEGGTQQGYPSVALLCKFKLKNSKGADDVLHVVAECTGRNFLAAATIVEAHVGRLVAKIDNKKANESMT